jgi:hypothetical protein
MKQCSFTPDFGRRTMGTPRLKFALRFGASLSAAALILGSSAAYAQDAEAEADDNDIVVTATKRNANLQDDQCANRSGHSEIGSYLN